MLSMLDRFALPVLVGALLGACDAHAAPGRDSYRDERVEVVLRSEQVAIAPGHPLAVGLEFRLAERWHVYWKNPGDSGEAPSVQWELPAGFTAGALQFPAPERIRTGPIVNYAYSGSVLLPTEIDVPEAIAPGTTVEIAAAVRWLACRAEECIPGEARLAKTLRVAPDVPLPDSDVAKLFASARKRLPEPRSATLERGANENSVALSIAAIARMPDATVEFFPLQPGIVRDGSEKASWLSDTRLRVEVERGELAPASLARLPGIIVLDSPGRRLAFIVDAVASTAATTSLWFALLLALGGGAILNLMPCVFPVLSLKVLSFVEQAGADARRVRLHGWAFTAGVLVAFWLLAGVLLALRAAGESLGWGFQLQSPAFLAALSATLLLLALSLSGVFEVGLSLTAVTSNRTEAMRGYHASFWTGALATLVATPCTAPFMGTALGYALTQPAAIGLLVFTALAVGMALPYLVLSYAPRLLARLPRPGPWMETFRQLMAFPLYATVLWLLHVFSRQTAPEATWMLMTALLLLAMAAWSWGVSQRHSGGTRLVGAIAPFIALAAGAIAVAAIRAPVTHGIDASEHAGSGFWQPWSPERVDTLRAEGKPVFVNFTADWCLSCQVNERVVFASDSVRELFRSYGIVPLEADWTNEDARIAETLASFGRDGVPLYVFYPSGGGAPRILPQVPTPASLREAFTGSAAEPPDPSEERKAS